MSIKHGDRHSPEYEAWHNMKSRCNNPNNNAYHNYGGRGIAICQEWEDYPTFLRDMGRKPHKDLTLDRIDNNKNYTPENCWWATRSVQIMNQRCQTKIGIAGVRLKSHFPSWQVTICFMGVRQYLGSFQDFFEACCARKSAEAQYK